MKAEPAVQRRLLELAEVDAELSLINHRRTAMPELAKVSDAEKSASTRRDAQVAVRMRLDDLDREVTRQEKEIDAVRARGERDRGLLAGGTIGAKQLTELQHELATVERRQSVLEDDLLELMERREAVEADGQHAEVELARAEEELAEAHRQRDLNLADLDTQQARRDAERVSILPSVEGPLLALYERKRARGIGAALLRARKCGACRLELDRREIARIRDLPADEIVECDQCGTILVRTPESGL